MMAIWRAVCRGAPAVALAVFLSGAVVLAQGGVSTFEQITVGTTAVGMAATTRNPTGRSQMNRCVIQAEGSVRWRDDGTDPTSTVGAVIARDDDPMSVSNAVARSIRFISTSAFSVLVNVTCYP